MGNPILKYEQYELIYEISREQVFIYGIYGILSMQLSIFLHANMNVLKHLILLLETPCPSVRSSVRNVFYPHLTHTHTNLICERVR